MPDVVPNELNFETTLSLTTAADYVASYIGKFDFPLMVEPSENKRIVNVITDVEYDWPPNTGELKDISTHVFNGRIATRGWAMGLYKAEPTQAQLITTGVDGTAIVTKGNANCYDYHNFVDFVSQGVAASAAAVDLAGSNIVRSNLMYMGVGTVVPNSYIWLGLARSRFSTAVWGATTTIKVGVRIKYVQTSIPLSEWVGLYFSSQQLAS